MIVETAENQGLAAQATILKSPFRVADIGGALDLLQKTDSEIVATLAKKKECGTAGGFDGPFCTRFIPYALRPRAFPSKASSE